MVTPLRRMSGRAVGSSVGAVFGVVFVVVSTGALGRPATVALRLLAVGVFMTCAVGVVRASRAARTGDPVRFGRGYWAVVAGEVVLLFAGRYVLIGPLDRPEAAVPWLTLVVGVHFFPLAVVLRAGIDHLLGIVLTGCGMAGLGLAFAPGDTATATALTAGVIPGFLLLAASLWGVRNVGPRPASAPVPAQESPSTWP